MQPVVGRDDPAEPQLDQIAGDPVPHPVTLALLQGERAAPVAVGA